jgi:hypothetical protein
MERMQQPELNMYDSTFLVIIFILVTHVQVAMNADFVLLLKNVVMASPITLLFFKSRTHNTRFFECFHTLQSYFHLG